MSSKQGRDISGTETSYLKKSGYLFMFIPVIIRKLAERENCEATILSVKKPQQFAINMLNAVYH